MTYTFTTTASHPASEHFDHNVEEFHAYLNGETPEWVNGDDTGYCCHTCQLVIVDRTDTPDLARTEFVTWVNGVEKYRGSDLESASRAWDAATYLDTAPPGGVAVHQYHGDTMVRDGWIMHVHESGTVYLSPHLNLA